MALESSADPTKSCVRSLNLPETERSGLEGVRELTVFSTPVTAYDKAVDCVASRTLRRVCCGVAAGYSLPR